MRAGDEDIIRFKFKYGVELIEVGAKLMIREGNTKCLGHVTKVYPMGENPFDMEKKFQGADKENQQLEEIGGYSKGPMAYNK